MSESTAWWVLAGAFVAIELLTGTIYLLLISLGFAAAAIAAHLDLSTSVQMMVAAGFGGGSVVILRAYRSARTPMAAPHLETDVNLDVGETVHIDEWNPDRTGLTKYRGATWQVSLAPGEVAVPGSYRIAEVAGNRLVLKKI